MLFSQDDADTRSDGARCWLCVQKKGKLWAMLVQEKDGVKSGFNYGEIFQGWVKYEGREWQILPKRMIQKVVKKARFEDCTLSFSERRDRERWKYELKHRGVEYELYANPYSVDCDGSTPPNEWGTKHCRGVVLALLAA
jgi:hypothetical protein